MHRYINRIYPAVSSLILLPDTDLTVGKSGYHPEIEGIMSKDGEKVTFTEVMKARLGVEHWVKCIGIHLRVTLRTQARSYKFHHDKVTLQDVERHWKETTSNLTTQMLILTTHSSMSRILLSKGKTTSLAEVKVVLLRMKEFTLENIKNCGIDEGKKATDVAKLFLLEYYLDVLSKSSSPEQMANNFLIQYTVCK